MFWSDVPKNGGSNSPTKYLEYDKRNRKGGVQKRRVKHSSFTGWRIFIRNVSEVRCPKTEGQTLTIQWFLSWFGRGIGAFRAFRVLTGCVGTNREKLWFEKSLELFEGSRCCLHKLRWHAIPARGKLICNLTFPYHQWDLKLALWACTPSFCP